MLFYTATIVFSLLVAVPIIILIYKTDSLANEAVSESIFDERVTTTNSPSVKKFRVKQVNLDHAKSTNRRKQLTDTPIRAEKPASVDRPFKIVTKEEPEIVAKEEPEIVTKEEPEIVTELANIVILESVCEPFNQGICEYLLNSETVK